MEGVLIGLGISVLVLLLPHLPRQEAGGRNDGELRQVQVHTLLSIDSRVCSSRYLGRV